MPGCDATFASVRALPRSSLELQALIARVRPDERREVLGALLALMGFMAGYGMLETARDALFLASLPASRLPWAYLAIASIAIVAVLRESRAGRRSSPRTELALGLLLGGAVTGGLWLLTASYASWVAFTLYVWSGVLASLAGVRIWTLVQGARVGPLLGVGGVTGALLGAAAAWLLVQLVEPRHLVLAASGAFLLSAAAPAALSPSGAVRPAQSTDWSAVLRPLGASRYFRRVVLWLISGSVALTLVDFVFKSTVEQHVAPEGLAGFFAAAYLAFSALALVLQVAGVAILLRLAGLSGAVTVLPAALLVASLGFAVTGGLAAALALRGVDGAFRHSLLRTTTNLLFAPVSPILRPRMRAAAEVVLSRGGHALAAVVILMVLSTVESLTAFAVLASVAATGWLALAVALRGPYLEAFRRELRGEGARDGSAFPDLDQASRGALVTTLNSADDRKVIAALEILAERGELDAVSAPLLFHPSPAVATRVVDSFAAAGRDDAVPILNRLVDHADPIVRAAGLRALAALDPRRQLFERALEDADPRVSATARAALVACGWTDGRELDLQLLDEVTRGDRGVQHAVAAALRTRPSPRLEEVLVELLRATDPAVLQQAIAAATKLQTPVVIGPLIALLAHRSVREQVRSALAEFGALGLERLTLALEAGMVPPEVRRHVPGAIAATGSVRAPEILLRHLEHEPDGLVRFKVLAALALWRKGQPDFPLDARLLQGALGYALTSALRLMGWHHTLRRAAALNPALATELHHVLVVLLRDKQRNTVERIFRLLDLQSGGEEFLGIHRGLRAPRESTRVGSRTLLDKVILPPLRDPVLRLVEDVPASAEPLGSAPSYVHDERAEYARVLADIVASGMESASSLAAVHSAELGLVSMRMTLETVQPLSAEHRRTLVTAVRQLGGVS